MKQKTPTKHSHYLQFILAVLFGLGVLILLPSGSAATYAVNHEVESATLSGQAAPATAAGASGSSAVRFGNLPVLPAEIRAITGGDSIALVWRASPSPDVQSYEVFRNNTKLATVTPNQGSVQMEREGRRYIDTAVTRGQTYQYQLRVVGANGQVSALSASVSARHPTATAPTPNLTFEYIRAPAPANKAAVEAIIRKELGIWYPKLGDAIAYPNYSPRTNLIIETNPDIFMGRAGNRIGYNPAELNATTMPDMLGGGLLHEAMHMVTDYGSQQKPTWLSEGIADWVRDDLTLERKPYIPHAGVALGEMQYASAAAYMRYISRTHRASFARDINLAVRANQYSSNYVTNLTGRSESQLLTDFKASHAGATGPISGPAGKCLTVSGSSTTNGTPLVLQTCNGSNAQQWTGMFEDAANKNAAGGAAFILNNPFIGASKCATAYSNMTVVDVMSWGCEHRDLQLVTQNTQGGLVVRSRNTCLATAGNATVDGSKVVLSTCDGSANQRWTLPK